MSKGLISSFWLRTFKIAFFPAWSGVCVAVLNQVLGIAFVKHGVIPDDGTLHGVPTLLTSSIKHMAVQGCGWLGWPLQHCLY